MKRQHRPSSKIAIVTPLCVECGKLGKLASGAQAYPDRPDYAAKMFYVCECGAMVGCHAGTGIALGRPANARTRWLRTQAHEALDAIWGKDQRSRLASSYARRRAYKWLAGELGIKPDACHIGWMGAEELQRVIEICRRTKRAA